MRLRPLALALSLAALLPLGIATPARAVIAAGGANVSEAAPEAPAAARRFRVQSLESAPAPQAGATTPHVAIQRHTLSNGLRLLMVEDHKAPVVTVQVWYQVGSRDEKTGITGVSHLLEHMMFQGSTNFPTGEFDRILSRNGGQNNAFTTEDYTAYYEVLASDRLPIALALEADRMMGAAIPPEKLKSEKNVVKEERRWRTENSPTGAAFEDLSALTFKAHPYHWPVIGWMSDLDAMSHEQVVGYYRSFYRPDNAILVVVGDIRPEQVIKQAEAAFGHLSPAKDFPRNPTIEPPQEGERRATVNKPIETPVVMAAYHIPQAGHPDLYALKLLDAILSSGKSSRLYRELVYRGRLAQQVGSGVSENKDPGMFYLYAQPMPGRSPEALEKAVYAQIERLQRELVSDVELKKALNGAESAFIFGQESSEELATALGTRASLTSAEDFNATLPKLRAVTKEDIRRVARAYLTPQNRSVVTVRPTPAAQNQEKK